MKTALITGVTGQAGSYLAQYLIKNNYRVVGTTRSNRYADKSGLQYVGVENELSLRSLNLDDFEQVIELIDEIQPDEIFHFGSPSSVARSFADPVHTIGSIVHGVSNLLESIRQLKIDTKFFNAASVEMYGDSVTPIEKFSILKPVSPYGIAKTSAYLLTRNYREAHHIYACSGILCNFESPLRPMNFVTRKVVSTACRIASGENIKLHLGDIRVERDWGWAPDYMEPIVKMLQLDKPDDIVICTGEKNSLEKFVELVFSRLGLDYKAHLEIDESKFRPLDIRASCGNPSQAKELLGWEAQCSLKDVVDGMIDAEYESNQADKPEKTIRLASS